MLHFWQRFRRDTSGNIAVMAALTIPVVMGLMGGATDLTLYFKMRAELEHAANAVALALAKEQNSTDYSDTAVLNDHVNRIFTSNFNPSNGGENSWVDQVTLNPQYTRTDGGTRVTLDVDADFSTTFLRLVGIDTMDLTYSTTAIQNVVNVEISLVLDVSASMHVNLSGARRIEHLIPAATGFVDEVLDDGLGKTSVSLIPFGGHVSLPQEVFDDFVVMETGPTTIIDPPAATYQPNFLTTNSRYRFTGQDDSRCLEARPDEFDDPGALIPDHSASQMRRYTRYGNSSVQDWYCPEAELQSEFLTDDPAVINDLLNEWDTSALSDGTGTEIGVLWGARALDPRWRGRLGGSFPDRPLDWDPGEAVKVMVLMSDGGITAQDRPRDPTRTDNMGFPHVSSGRLRFSAVGRGSTSLRMDTLPSAGPFGNTAEQFLQTCRYLRDNSVVVYTIAFDQNASGWAAQLLAECASSPVNAYVVTDLDIDAVFSEISASIGALRISE